MQVADLETRIHSILLAPGTDLSTISAKRVRRLLLEQDDVPPELIKDNKQPIDELISNVFARVSEEKGFQHDRDEDEEEAGGGATRAESAPKKRRRPSPDDHGDRSSPKNVRPSTAGDEALARQLSEEINGRGRSSRSGAASGTSSTRGGRGRGRGRGRARGRSGKANGTRSADTIHDSDNEGSDGDESKKKRGGGLSKEYNLSEPLAALVQEDALSRPQVVKRLWAYIKTNNLQNPTNGREILCDGALRAVFNTDKIDMFKMNKELGKHLSDPSETTA
ncbi:SWIB-domain-containing protein [Russula earlei]|uniref:SWIB-domain-containing protein n=1 Tax=Russula earlei TaxID=71964 RepID=A0ACC0UB46_9AGAM|nr:SWIB-domain-containing protein [Russula earlei]